MKSVGKILVAFVASWVAAGSVDAAVVGQSPILEQLGNWPSFEGDVASFPSEVSWRNTIFAVGNLAQGLTLQRGNLIAALEECLGHQFSATTYLHPRRDLAATESLNPPPGSFGLTVERLGNSGLNGQRELLAAFWPGRVDIRRGAKDVVFVPLHRTLPAPAAFVAFVMLVGSITSMHSGRAFWQNWWQEWGGSNGGAVARVEPRPALPPREDNEHLRPADMPPLKCSELRDSAVLFAAQRTCTAFSGESGVRAVPARSDGCSETTSAVT